MLSIRNPLHQGTHVSGLQNTPGPSSLMLMTGEAARSLDDEQLRLQPSNVHFLLLFSQ